MRIGEFARLCGTKISVLRHYDSCGLLNPVYVDRFSEYRYYDESQRAVFEQISELKSAGFTLNEIKELINGNADSNALFERKKRELELALCRLEELKESFKGGIKMNNDFKPLVEDISGSFENDEQVIGKWQIIRDNEAEADALPERYIYFLPNGEQYWCFGWTKGSLIIDDGESRYKNDYRLEKRGDDLYMIVSLKAPDYPQTGKTEAVALRKLDSKHYTKADISKKDDINKPFREDERVIGKWRAFCFLESKGAKEAFEPEEYEQMSEPYFKEIEFLGGGECRAVFADGVTEGRDNHSYTKGFWIRKYNSTACAYEIKEAGGREYLIIEWKSGDYRFGGLPTDYYVMVRA